MPLPAEEQAMLERMRAPADAIVRARADEFMARTGLRVKDLASGIEREYGRCGLSTLLSYLRGDYEEHGGRWKDLRWMRTRVHGYVDRHWPKQENAEMAPALATRGYHKIRACFEDGLEAGAWSVIYGPPSAEKSFIFQHLVAERRAAGKLDAAVVICGAGNSKPLCFLQDVARAFEIWIARAWTIGHYRDRIVDELLRRPGLPVLILDEAQHLPIDTLETLRLDLQENYRLRAKRYFGLLIGGSHNIYADFRNPARRGRLEQWQSRIARWVQLEGMDEDEALKLAGRALGNGKPAILSEAQRRRVLDESRVEDRYATDEEGRALKAPRIYYSSRRLLEYLRRARNTRIEKILAGGAG